MTKRPLSVALIGWLFIATGSVGLVYHTVQERHPFNSELIWIVILRLLAIVGGAFLLRGHNWARWLLIAWMAYHVVLSAFHPPAELVTHVVVLVAVVWLLFRPEASAFFRGARANP
jgi:uncharacterized membrane protein